MMQVYLVQMESLPGKKSENLEKARQMLLSAKPAPRGLILFPEMFATGYVPEQAGSLAEDFESENAPTAKMLRQLAQETGCNILGGGIHKVKGGYANRTILYTPDGNSAKFYYDKMHPFFPEQKEFFPGKELKIFSLQNFSIASFICYDLRFSEGFRKARMDGAQAFTVQAAWPAVRNDHWETLLKARAIESQAYVIAVNNVSADGTYIGNSQIISPEGNCIAKAESGKEQVVQGEISLDLLEQFRKDFPQQVI